MKNKFLAGILLFLAGSAFAGSDRFGAERRETARSSFTTSSDAYVIISSVPSDNVGSLVLRSISFSGLQATTVTVYDTNLKPNIGPMTTAYMVQYVPLTGDGKPTQVDVDLFISSALMYNKVGTAPTLLKWDWMSLPVVGEDRP